MPAVPAKIAARITAGIKRFQPILTSARARDVNESDTVVIVADVLQEILGYDKYSEITSEHLIRGTYCDLAVKLDGSLVPRRGKSDRAGPQGIVRQASGRLRRQPGR